MPTHLYKEAEKKAKALFKPGAKFEYLDNHYKVIKSGKPVSQEGTEVKTDLYISCEDNFNKNKEFKLSIKLDNAAHAVNKIKKDTFNSIFPKNAQKIRDQILKNTAKKLSNLKLIFFENFEEPEDSGKCKIGYKISLGWLPEIEYKDSDKGRGLSISLNAPQEFKNTILSGEYLEDDHKNAKVNGKTIDNSGVANLILKLPDDKKKFINEDINFFSKNIMSIEDYSKDKNFFLILKLVSFFSRKYKSNHRSENQFNNQWETRYPIIYIDWKLKNNKLAYEFVFNADDQDTNTLGEHLRKLLQKLTIHYKNFDEDNTKDYFKDQIYDKNIIQE
jgi:hypothetical protein